MSSNWRPRRLKPRHLEVLRLHFQGIPNHEIESLTGIPASTISGIVNSQDAEEILAELYSGTLDTISDVATDAQAIAPRIFEEQVKLALTSKDDRVRASTGMNVLAIAGHLPVRRIHVQNDNAEGELAEMNELELKQHILQSLGQNSEEDSKNKILH